jgi:hypothetical protein
MTHDVKRLQEPFIEHENTLYEGGGKVPAAVLREVTIGQDYSRIYKNNKVVTTKYTMYNFFPKNLIL